MSLTIGTGPFARPKEAEKHFNFLIDAPEHILFFENSPKRIRIVFNKQVIADSEHAKMLHETGHLPVYYLPEKDIQMELLSATAHHTHCPFKGEAAYWSVKVGKQEAKNAAWSYPKPMKGAPSLKGYYAFYWEAMDAWFEEDEPVVGHPRDPYHRVDVRSGTRHVVVSVNGETVADTCRPMLLFETGLPTRYYIPRGDVNNGMLLSSIKKTICPYKGNARYWSIKTASGIEKDLVWGYDEPLAEAEKVAGYLCFVSEAEAVEMKVTRQE